MNAQTRTPFLVGLLYLCELSGYLLIIPTERQPVHSLHLILPQFVIVLVDSRLLVLFPIIRFGTILELKKQVFMFNAVLYIF